jgi:hypothetical protein
VSADTGVRVTHKNRRTFTMIWDDLFVEGMSLRAWGLFCYLMSRPEGWECRASELSGHFAEGRDAVRAVMSELVDLRLLVREEYREGNLCRVRYLLDSAMVENPRYVRSAPVGPETDSQSTETQSTESQPQSKNVGSNHGVKDLPSSGDDDEVEGTIPGLDVPPAPAPVPPSGPGFEDFWQAYPRKVGKGAARKAWDAAVGRKRVDPRVIITGARRYAADPNLPTEAEKSFIPHPSTWLNAERWGDEPLPPRPRPGGPGGPPPAPGGSIWDMEPVHIRVAREFEEGLR